MVHGKFYGLIAFLIMKNILNPVIMIWKTEPSGLFTDEQNYVLGDKFDGKIIFNKSYGVLEVKCSEEYKDVDPKDVCFVSKSPCIRYWKDSKKIKICKVHIYYDQIQMQLALICQSFCDIMFYTSKRMVIE